MDIRKRIVESLSSSWKARIDLYLRKEGYVTYADRLTYFKFIIADVYHGSHIEVAAMFPDSAEIVINPAFVDEKNFGGNTKKMMDQLSLLVRHELLHFLLVHEQRLIEHMEKKYPDWKRKFGEYSIRQLDNYAADWDLSKEGYDDHDKEVARLMSVNNRVLGGLILSDNHPEWIDLTYEEILDKLIEENVKQMEKTRQQLKKQLQQKKQQSQNQGSNDNNIDNAINSQNDLGLEPDSASIGDSQGQDGQNITNSNDDSEQTNSNDDSDQTDNITGDQNQEDEADEEDENSQDSNGQKSRGNQKDSQSENDDEQINQDNKNDRNDNQNSQGNEEDDEESFEDLEKQAYASAWNEILDRFDRDEIEDDELIQLLNDIESGKIDSI